MMKSRVVVGEPAVNPFLGDIVAQREAGAATAAEAINDFRVQAGQFAEAMIGLGMPTEIFTNCEYEFVKPDDPMRDPIEIPTSVTSYPGWFLLKDIDLSGREMTHVQFSDGRDDIDRWGDPIWRDITKAEFLEMETWGNDRVEFDERAIAVLGTGTLVKVTKSLRMGGYIQTCGDVKASIILGQGYGFKDNTVEPENMYDTTSDHTVQSLKDAFRSRLDEQVAYYETKLREQRKLNRSWQPGSYLPGLPQVFPSTAAPKRRGIRALLRG